MNDFDGMKSFDLWKLWNQEREGLVGVERTSGESQERADIVYRQKWKPDHDVQEFGIYLETKHNPPSGLFKHGPENE